MIIQCDKCQSKFRLDDSRVTNTGVRVKCTKCGNVFAVMPPATVQPDEPVLLESPQSKPETKPPAKKTRDDKFQEEIDFSSFGAETNEQDDSGTSAPAKADKGSVSDDESDFDSGFSGSGLDSFGQDDADRKKDGDEGYFGGMDFGFDDKKEDDALQTSQPSPPNDRSSIFDIAPGPVESDEAAQMPPVANTPRRNVAEGMTQKLPTAGAAGAYTKAGAPVDDDTDDDELGTPSAGAPTAGADLRSTNSPATPRRNVAEGTAQKPPTAGADSKTKDKTGDFSDILAGSAEDVLDGKVGPFEDAGEPNEIDEDELEAALRPPDSKKSTKAVVLALIVIIFLGLAYFTGFTGKLTSLFSSSTSAVKTFELEGMKGYYVENKSMDKVFVIEAKVRNLTDGFLEVKSVEGAIYGVDGKLIANEKSSPGRLVSADDLKALNKDELLKPLRDKSSGLIPPKGSIPVMVVFTLAPEGINEFGLDVIR